LRPGSGIDGFIVAARPSAIHADKGAGMNHVSYARENVDKLANLICQSN
jgi:hypothetical protein